MINEWKDIFLAATAAIPATIAAVSSVKNGRVLRNGRKYTLPSSRLDSSAGTESGSQKKKFGHN